MSATRSFRLGYSIIGWGGTPDLDEALMAIGLMSSSELIWVPADTDAMVRAAPMG